MSMAAERVEHEGAGGQVEVTVRQAAEISGVSVKQVRRWIRESKVRATMREAKHGPTWHIEAASLPPRPAGMDTARAGVGEGGDGTSARSGEGAEGVAAALLGMVREKDAALDERRRELEAATGRIGYLESEAEKVKALTERAQSLEGERSDLRERAAELAGEIREEKKRGDELRRSLVWHRAGVLLVVAMTAGGAVWVWVLR